MKRYFAIAGLLFLALTINIAWTGKAPGLDFGADRHLRVRHAFYRCWHVYRGVVSPLYPPDWISTSGAVETFKAKVFWLMGPQAIRALIGFFAFQGFMNNILGYAV
ncbi:hypothetical protein H2136_23420 [Aeromonas hydrophila]|uniref:Uncharacterized protein n=1 Tax=Aeromonas hydrophila TaxID=644 RepID=A0A926FPE7_AERHY|nr:hypothetical protein [Aeromonas hydrophila]